jgi:hypothetical protein
MNFRYRGRRIHDVRLAMLGGRAPGQERRGGSADGRFRPDGNLSISLALAARRNPWRASGSTAGSPQRRPVLADSPLGLDLSGRRA